MKTQINSAGFNMSSSNVVAKSLSVNPNDYGKTLVDEYGRSYVQTPNGKIY